MSPGELAKGRAAGGDPTEISVALRIALFLGRVKWRMT
jgi:hypothetical protein